MLGQRDHRVAAAAGEPAVIAATSTGTIPTNFTSLNFSLRSSGSSLSIPAHLRATGLPGPRFDGARADAWDRVASLGSGGLEGPASATSLSSSPLLLSFHSGSVDLDVSPSSSSVTANNNLSRKRRWEQEMQRGAGGAPTGGGGGSEVTVEARPERQQSHRRGPSRSHQKGELLRRKKREGGRDGAGVRRAKRDGRSRSPIDPGVSVCWTRWMQGRRWR